MRNTPPSGLANRRRFLKTSSAAGAAFLAAGPLGRARAAGANERLSVGLIGAGGQGNALANQVRGLAESHNAEITALCDVWRVNLERAAEQVEQGFGRRARTTTRFAELLELDDVDAVIIATTDNAHTPILLAALEAGKDVYVEKPMSITIEEANAALDATRRTGRVVQVGTQWRSQGNYIAARDLLATGILGKVNRVTAAMNFNEPRWARGYDDCRADDVDWEAYLFNRPMVDFDPRLLRRWHLYKMFTNGLAGLWMSHYASAVQFLLGTGCPTSAVSHGGIYVWDDGREHTDTFQTVLDYPEGFLFSWAMGLGNSAGVCWSIHGTLGTADLEAWTVSPAGGRSTDVEEAEITPAPGISHMGNWLECIRLRGTPTADIVSGHQHSVTTVLAADALTSGRRLVYDPQTRTITPA